jgi:type II secretory pathway pseudopilin PulG
MSKKIKKNKIISGFTLIEVVMANVMLIVLVLAGLSFYQYCSHSIVDSKLRLMAANFARETMEMRYFDDTLTETGGVWQNDTALPTGAAFGALLRDNHDGTRQYKVTSSPSGPYLILETKVTWNE